MKRFKGLLTAILVLLTSITLLVGCAEHDWKPNPQDPLQQSIVINVARLGTASYLDKNSSELSVGRVVQLGDILDKLDDEAALSMSVASLGNLIHFEMYIAFKDDLKPVQQESVRMIIDTVLLAAVQWAQTTQESPVDKAYLEMLALAGQNIKDVAKNYQ